MKIIHYRYRKDYIEEEKKNKALGDLGEQFIYDQECMAIKQYKLPKSKQVEWTARDKKKVQGQYCIRKGSLEELCMVPVNYRVDLLSAEEN